MNRRVSVRRRVGTTASVRLACLLLGLVLSAGVARAQPAPPPTAVPPTAVPPTAAPPAAGATAAAILPASMKSAPSAEPFRQQIQQFIQGQLQLLTGDDPAAQKAAREKLINECT